MVSAKPSPKHAEAATLAESLLRDFNFALRLLRKSPAFLTVTIVTLALGIGATTAVFSVVDTVLLRPLPYGNPQQLVFVWEPNPRYPGVPLEAWGPVNADFYDWQRQSHSFSSMALFTTNRVNLATGDQAVRVIGSRVTGQFFQVLGVEPAVGRTISSDDDQPGRADVVVISQALWESQFGSNPDVLRSKLELDGHNYRVIGVMPEGFSFPHGNENIDTIGKRTDAWIPWAMTLQEKAARDQDPGYAIARLRPGVSVAEAGSEMKSIAARLDPLHTPELRGSEAAVRPLDTSVAARSKHALLIFMASVLVVLLIACSNVASLLLAHASGRTVEMTIRSALGASRSRLLRQVLVESVCLSAIGGFFGAAACYLLITVLRHINPGHIPRMDEVTVNVPVLMFALLLSLGTGLVFGLLPALSLSQSDLNQALKGSGQRTLKQAGVVPRALMIGEVALTVLLLAGSGLLIRSFLKLRSVDKGFAPSSVVTMNLELDNRYSTAEKWSFYRTVLERTQAIAGVQSAGAISQLPLGGGESLTMLLVEGHAYDRQTFFEYRSITPNYFPAMGIPLLQGRNFTQQDLPATHVAIVSRSFAQRYYPSGNAIGRHFRNVDGSGTPSQVAWTVVGVVPDVRQANLASSPPMQVYMPLWGSGLNSISVVARTGLTAGQLAADMRAVVRALDPTIAVADVHTMNELVSEAMAERRFQTVLLSSFGGFALFLSLVGMYAMLAYSVRRRTAEIGIRMALGARRGNVLRMVLTEGAGTAIAGLLVGLLGSWALTRLLSSLLFEVKPLDPATFMAVSVLFCVVALLACYIPAARASMLDPMIALRDQ